MATTNDPGLTASHAIEIDIVALGFVTLRDNRRDFAAGLAMLVGRHADSW